MNYTEEQEKIINAVDGRVAVIACPGSGKTTTMLARIHHMINGCGINPGRILMVTFTKAAADHMKEKFAEMDPDYAPMVCFSTIHSMCYSILRNEYHINQANIIPRWEQIKFFKGKLEDIKKEAREDAARTVITTISAAVNSGIDPEKVLKDTTIDLFGRGYEMVPLYRSYLLYKKEKNKIDFDDMLILALKCLRRSPLTLQKYQSMYDYIMIDEFQDTNRVQANIFYLLTQKHGNLCIVGDDDQSIYGFRAANPKIMLGFKKKFPDAQIFYLSCNYRSGEKIIKYAGNLISKNKSRYPKSFKAGLDIKSELYIGKYDLAFQEKNALIKWVEAEHNKGIPYNQMAVLYRVNREATGMLPSLKKAGIPISIRENPDNIHSHFIFDMINAYYHLAKELYVIQQKNGDQKDEIIGIHKDAVSQYMPKVLNCPNRYLKADFFKECTLTKESIKECMDKFLAANPKTEFWRRDNIKDALTGLRGTIYYLSKRLNNTKEFLKVITNTDGFDEWLEKQAEHRMVSVASLESTLNDIVAEGSDFKTVDEWMDYVGDYDTFIQSCGKNPDGLTLSTFHSAKGLEWDKVWIKNVSKKIVPYTKSVEENAEEGTEEERRMFYVAVTRARNEVQISYVDTISPFITDLVGSQEILKKNIKGGQRSFSSLGFM